MKQIKDKTGSVPLYLVVTAIIIGHMSDEGGAHSLR